MTKKLVSLYLITAIVIGFPACELDRSSTVEPHPSTVAAKSSDATLLNMIDSAGIMHNALLSHAYTDLAANNLVGPFTKDQLLDYTDNFFDANYPAYDSSNSYQFMAESGTWNVVDSIDVINTIDTSSYLSVSAKSLLHSAVDAQNSYFDSTITLGQFTQACDSLIDKALSLPDDAEVYSVGIPVSVMKYSAQYWDANIANWAAQGGQTFPEIQYGFSKKQRAILRADGQGAILGLVAAAAGTSFTGPIAIAIGAIGGMLTAGFSSLSAGIGAWIDDILYGD